MVFISSVLPLIATCFNVTLFTGQKIKQKPSSYFPVYNL